MLNDTDIESDAEAVSRILTYLLEDECLDIDYEVIIEADRQTSWDSDAVVGGFRQYTYQACTQVRYHIALSLIARF